MAKLTAAAGQGDVDARHALGLIYFYGEGVVADQQQARFWFEKAAAQHDPRAQVKLGEIYARGIGVKQDFTQAEHGMNTPQQAMTLPHSTCWGRCMIQTSQTSQTSPFPLWFALVSQLEDSGFPAILS